jgi:hypothetical protein
MMYKKEHIIPTPTIKYFNMLLNFEAIYMFSKIPSPTEK